MACEPDELLDGAGVGDFTGGGVGLLDAEVDGVGVCEDTGAGAGD